MKIFLSHWNLSIFAICAKTLGVTGWTERGTTVTGAVCTYAERKKYSTQQKTCSEMLKPHQTSLCLPWVGLACECVYVQTISVSVNLGTGFVKREDREDMCTKASRFILIVVYVCVCLYVHECVFVRMFGRFPFHFCHIRPSAVFPGQLSVSLIMGWWDQVQPWQPQGVPLW